MTMISIKQFKYFQGKYKKLNRVLLLQNNLTALLCKKHYGGLVLHAAAVYGRA